MVAVLWLPVGVTGGAMGLSYGIFIRFLLLGGMELCCPQTIWPTETYYPLTSRPPVMVDCLESQLVVTVSKDLFGTGKLIRPADLTLGPENCEPLASMDTDDVVRFEVGLHECGSRVQVTDNALVYSTFLIHSPRPAGNLSILRTNRAEVPIECHYPRHSNVSSQAILPTWVPFRTTMLFEEKLVFSLRLMEEDWGSEKQSPTFQLGDIAHLQAEVHTGSHMPLRLFVDHCVATLIPDRNAFPHHKIVDFHGCLVDGLYNASSAFKAPRPRPETLQFTVDVFHFAKDSRNTIYITCHLKVTPADRVPDQLNKACSFIKSTKRWYPVEGSADICRCCNKGSCGLPGRSRRLSHLERRWRKSVSHTRNRRHESELQPERSPGRPELQPQRGGALTRPPRLPQPRCPGICVAESARLSDLLGFCCLHFISRWELKQVIPPKDLVSLSRRDSLCQLSREKRSAGSTGQ